MTFSFTMLPCFCLLLNIWFFFSHIFSLFLVQKLKVSWSQMWWLKSTMPATENWSNLLISSSQESLNNERLCGLFFTSLLKRDAICCYLCLAVGNQYRTCQILDTSKIVYSPLSIEIGYSFIFLDNILRNAKLI